ncbi:MAG TPA: S9 family peptidase [Bacteroidetes bacterium]|nr:S9 family peptidase [Bacteroidota bacterium]
MKKLIAMIGCLLFAGILFSQKKQLGHEELVTWKQVERPRISNDGKWVAYSLKAEEGDAELKVWNAGDGLTYTFERGEGAVFSANSEYLIFKIHPHEDSLKDMRRREVKKDDLPKDTLGILKLDGMSLEKTANVKSFKVPEKWDGWIAFQKEIEKIKLSEAKSRISIGKEEVPKDSTATAMPDSTKLAKPKKKGHSPKKKKPKKESKKNGTKLVIRHLPTGEENVVGFVKKYRLAKEGPSILLTTTGNDSTLLEGVYLFDCAAPQLKPLWRQKGEYKQLSLDEKGKQVSFLANLDTTGAQVPPFQLFYWKNELDSAKIIADQAAPFLPDGWLISENANPYFSKDGSKLYFGIAPPPILQDTSLLDEEIVNVEVWSYTDGRLHTQQKARLDREKKRSYRTVWHVDENKFVQIGSADLPEAKTGSEGNADVALAYTEDGYLQLISWEGSARKDLFLIDLKTGNRKEIVKGLRGNPSFSPAANYVFWYNRIDSVYQTYSVKNGSIETITKNTPHPFYYEENDVPNYPWAYGVAAWTKDDKHVLIYDKYDIWQVDPSGNEQPLRLTQGRENNIMYRYIRLDPEERFVTPGQRMMLRIFDEKTMASGYGYLLLGAGKPIQLVKGDYAYARRVTKAKNADKIIFTKENFQTFPDLLYSDLSLQNPKRVSNANPQQSKYSWGSIELYEWTSLDGQKLRGMLVKPEGFDPSKKYPMLVNFYEKSSDRLNRYHRPYPGRSTINYSFYASRGYLIFNPDVPYRIGYPGESCLNAVISGVTSLIDKGFVDREKIGVQGHSWGGYQVAYLLTKTDIFKCAESGAPVVNMFSAYGGIRWGSGLSRMFQYEHTQSRIGGTIWEYPLRYLENSPLFFLDKVNTPVLILHNDKDGAVPWYQGIEYFVGLRRLGKPSWLLNYNGEPHWPVKLQNRKDFQKRMSQFFDHYLKDEPMPQWMQRGVPAIEKGILQGLEMKE